ncbi:DUF3107 domain-containing protein [Corynebacterium choanae]|uniref:DUF3107 domain-containing protein n=1 Tax=Corynebacterium choanae TaxID=1862358 RepID=A0A3G6J4D3_9CORY|nr:DUF3107 domain-containing protein [Corynebacterium choanae]AZA12935.1 hypothetical protein CCHOA_02590 [Corynebacterium choanae]
MIDIKIGFVDSARDITVTTSDDRETVLAKVREALERKEGLLELAQEKGQLLLVQAQSIAYVQIGESAHGRVGFAVN